VKIKQFLKLDWRKIVIFVILSAFIYLTYFAIGKLDLYQPENTYLAIIFDIIFLLPNFILTSILFLITLFYANTMTPTEFGLFKISNTYKIISSAFSITGWILVIIYWYILSCLIVWVYEKVKKKK
jgi:hypothetical protein